MPSWARPIYDDPHDKSEAVETLVTKLDEGKEPKAIRAVIIHTLGELGDRRARNAIARVVNDPNTDAILKVEAYRALGKVGKAEDAMTLVRLMNTEPLEDCRIAAIEGIGALKAKDPRIYHILIEGMEHEDPAIRLQSYRALKQITGKDVGNRPECLATRAGAPARPRREAARERRASRRRREPRPPEPQRDARRRGGGIAAGFRLDRTWAGIALRSAMAPAARGLR